MDDIGTSLPELSKLIEQRLALLRSLAESLEWQHPGAGAKRRGSDCARCGTPGRTLPAMEPTRRPASSRGGPAFGAAPGWTHPAIRRKPSTRRGCKPSGRRSEPGSVISRACTGRCCGTLKRSLAVLNRVVDSCAATYTPDPGLLRTEAPARHPENCSWRITMSGLFGSLSIALSGLSVSQQEMATTSNNVANANTPGYSREVSDVTAGDPVGDRIAQFWHRSGPRKNREPARPHAPDPNQSGNAAEQRAQRLADATATDSNPVRERQFRHRRRHQQFF